VDVQPEQVQIERAEHEMQNVAGRRDRGLCARLGSRDHRHDDLRDDDVAGITMPVTAPIPTTWPF
jgi:hypothetical protein